jgi:hypothetical protein
MLIFRMAQALQNFFDLGLGSIAFDERKERVQITEVYI